MPGIIPPGTGKNPSGTPTPRPSRGWSTTTPAGSGATTNIFNAAYARQADVNDDWRQFTGVLGTNVPLALRAARERAAGMLGAVR